MLEKIPSTLFLEWIAFSQVEPFGTEANFLGHAITASTVANANRDSKTKAYKTEAFMPKFKKKKKQSVDGMLQVAKMITMSLGGTVKEK